MSIKVNGSRKRPFQKESRWSASKPYYFALQTGTTRQTWNFHWLLSGGNVACILELKSKMMFFVNHKWINFNFSIGYSYEISILQKFNFSLEIFNARGAVQLSSNMCFLTKDFLFPVWWSLQRQPTLFKQLLLSQVKIETIKHFKQLIWFQINTLNTVETQFPFQRLLTFDWRQSRVDLWGTNQ